MVDRTALTRRGCIDDFSDLESMDIVAFNDGNDIFAPNKFMHGGFGWGKEKFRQRLQDWGMTGHGCVYDAGCGYGRWSVFLAEVNEKVIGVERNVGGCKVAEKLADHFGLDNVEAIPGDLRKAPLKDESVDAVWCYNVMQFLNRGDLLKDLNRVLKPGGVLGLGLCNSTGRVLEKLFRGLRQGGLEHRSAQFALTSLKNGPEFNGRPNYAVPESIEATLEEFGFCLSEGYEVEVAFRRLKPEEARDDIPYTDVPSLIAAVEADPDSVIKADWHAEMASRFPLNVHARAEKIS